MDQTKELLLLVMDLNIERMTPSLSSGVKVVLMSWSVVMAEVKCLSLSRYCWTVSGRNSRESTSERKHDY